MASSKKALGILFGVKGGSSINQGSGALILQDLKKIVNQVNSNNKLLPKVELRFDVSDAIKSINKLQKTLSSLQEQTKNVNLPNGGKGGGKSSAYTQNLTAAKKYFKELKALQKAAVRTAGVNADESGNILGVKGDNYKNHYAYYHKLETDYKKLDDVISDDSLSTAQKAKALKLTINEYRELSQVISELQQQSGVAFDKIKADATAAWQKQASNVSDSIHRVYDTISKNPAVKELADDILKMTKQGSGNVEELKQKFQEFNLKARQTGADIETWGQKFKKAFANQVRSALASLITVDIGQILKGIYDNVVALDDAVVNLQIASGKTREATKGLVKEYAALAKQLKTTTAEVAESADTWLRQGYNTEQATTLITNSTMLAKLGQIEAADASTALTSAMKGYKVAVEDTVNIVDKLTAVDMEAAASAGGIATAMAETSASANLAGVSMDTLIGYIATVKEVTQDSDEAVGTFFKTMFARMGNIKVGKFVDEDGESLNDVEAVLGELGIQLRMSSGEFRDFSDVLDEVGERWNGYNDVQKHAIATAVAGTRQQEKFLTLMSNYDTALDYATTAINSAGTATEKYGAYTDGVTAKINELKAAFEELSLSVLDSDFLSHFIDLLTKLTGLGSGVANVIDSLGGLPSLLTIVSGILITTKYESIVNLSKSIFSVGKSVFSVTKELGLVIPKFIAARVAGTSFGDSVTYAFNDVSKAAGTAKMKIGLVSAAISIAVVAIGAVVSAIDKHNAKMEEQASNLIQSAEAHANNARAIMDEIDALSLLADEYDDLTSDSEWKINEASLKRVKELQQDIADLVGDQKHDTDLVNGALEDQKTILVDITKEKYEQLKLDAAKQKEDAKAAYRTFTNKTGQNEVWSEYFYEDDNSSRGSDEYAAYKELLDKYKVDYDPSAKRLLGGVIRRSFGVQTEYSSIDDFVTQYENLKKLQDYLIESEQASSYSALYDTINTYMKEYGEFYSTYTDALKLEQEIEEWRAKNAVQTPAPTTRVSVALKPILDILNELQPGYDGLAEVLASVTEGENLSAEALEKLLELSKEGQLGGLDLSAILIKNADGYSIAANALGQFIEKITESAVAAAKVNYADAQSKLNAIENLENYRRVLITLIEAQGEASDSTENQKDSLNDSLDAYKELIELRKDLIETYAEELEYQRELEKKQQRVASLQTKLAVARLDGSAAGQARVRELEAELQEAQEDLEDFTLEQAIQEILDGLDNQYSEYENFIKAELKKIGEKIDGTKPLESVEIEGLKESLLAIEQAIADIKGAAMAGDPEYYDSALKELKEYVVNNRISRPESWRSVDDVEYTRLLTKAIKPGGTNGHEVIDSIDWYFDEREKLHDVKSMMAGEILWDKMANGGANRQKIQAEFEAAWSEIMKKVRAGDSKGAYELFDLLKSKTLSRVGAYHSGGFVGGSDGLKHNEEFAKLMKREFVSTPAQIKNFMSKTLPQIASFSTSAGNEFNAPLIEIKCESVTSESMPKLKEIVDEAVGEIKRCLDGGMSRTGYKRSVKKLLT